MSNDVIHSRETQLYKPDTETVGTTGRAVAHLGHRAVNPLGRHRQHLKPTGRDTGEAHRQIRPRPIHLTCHLGSHTRKIPVHRVNVRAGHRSGRLFPRDDRSDAPPHVTTALLLYPPLQVISGVSTDCGLDLTVKLLVPVPIPRAQICPPLGY